MGLLMISTVFLSIFWAMCFFTSIIALWGPEGDSGDLKKYFKCCQKKKTMDADGNRRETYNDYQVGDGDTKPYKTMEMTDAAA